MSRIMAILLSCILAVGSLSAGKLNFVITYPQESDGILLEGATPEFCQQFTLETYMLNILAVLRWLDDWNYLI